MKFSGFSSLLLILFITNILFAQNADTINKTDENGLKQGYWKKKDKAGSLIYTGHFTDNIPLGEFNYYYDDGRLRAKSEISNSGQNAFTITYHKNGRVMSEGFYKNQKKDSVWHFYDVYGQKLTNETYSGGILEGKFVTFYQSGDTTEILFYNNGLKEGSWKQYYKNGVLKTNGFFVNDTLNDTITYHFKNGAVQSAGKYFKGLMDGKWTHFNEEGLLERTEYYDKGRKTGQETLIEIHKEKK